MLRRDTMLNLEVGRLETKEDGWRFEGGRRSLTRQILGKGQDVLIVGRDGRGFRIDE
jgi:hypothetical protein